VGTTDFWPFALVLGDDSAVTSKFGSRSGWRRSASAAYLQTFAGSDKEPCDNLVHRLGNGRLLLHCFDRQGWAGM
jgi:hypothetical protein